MVDKLNWDQNEISWYFGHDIVKRINNIILASVKKDRKIIFIEAGTNFITEQVYYFLYNGDSFFMYDKISGIVEWNANGALTKKKVDNIKQVSYYPDEQRILILKMNDYGSSILGLDLMEDLVFEISEPKGYRMEYLSEINQAPVVVCEGDENHVDTFGRGRMNFFINLKTAQLKKGNLAY
ncbi:MULTISPECIES: hypothetical protein [unclassified Bacillus (in: firmicutes)]|uniref:hypothetical protein n=1 Tax=unclassified Bacillus (in: firmicutes) TaxID=185979 RepID=UPI001BEB6959|nr:MULTISPECIES: hypothetical protein [unclassified Bacillus (in: firmicutes)]MBT2719732.1 hypothetical protein [Bacillus sp. ISL-46]MBT2742173.1 hypothetical protein [Bacillus sp. ISL-77]